MKLSENLLCVVVGSRLLFRLWTYRKYFNILKVQFHVFVINCLLKESNNDDNNVMMKGNPTGNLHGGGQCHSVRRFAHTLLVSGLLH